MGSKPAETLWKIFKQLRELSFQVLKSDDMYIYIVCTNRWKIRTISQMLFL